MSVERENLVLSGVRGAWRHEDTRGVEWTDGVVWGDIRILREDGVTWTATLSKDEGAAIAKAITDHARSAAIAKLIELCRSVQPEAKRLRDRLSGQHYVREGLARSYAGKAGELLTPWVSHPMLRREDISRLPEDAKWWTDFLRDPLQTCRASNERWMQRESKRYKTFFDSLGNKGLTDEQRMASVALADRALVSAAAGSGKTSTLVGKVGYLLLAGHAEPEEILLLAFNRTAAQELTDRINRDLAPILQGRHVPARTFHAFGLEVLGKATGRRPALYDPDSEGGELVAWSNMIDQLAVADSAFSADWWLFRALFLKPAADPASFRTVEEWEEYVDKQGTWGQGRGKGFLTLQGEFVKSQGELAIANWLALNGVPYEYERAYEYETADETRRQYHPDFYLPGIATYIEHFAVDKDGRVPPAFGEEYARSMEWKRALHRDKGTHLIETTFAAFVDGTLFSMLEAALQKAGQKLSKTPKGELLEKLKEQQEVEFPLFLMSVLRPFVSHAKNNRIDLASLENGAVDGDGSYREQIFCRLMARLMSYYDRRLRDGNLVDFDDMVLMAGDAVEGGQYQSPFKVVLVDEFQDISRARARLVRSLVQQRESAMLLGVGDVRQSIYRFAGSDVAIFRDFGAHFGAAATMALTRTFRFNQGIADVSSDLVQEDAEPVVSDMDETEDVVRLRLYERQNALRDATISVLKEIAEELQRQDKRSASVMVLYRVNAIGRSLGDLPGFGVLDIERMSIHRSKGLEADYVILTGVVGGGSGAFPSKTADDPLLQLVMPEKEPAEAEERRLLYVALTRGRRAAYVVASSSRQSDFVGELIEMANTSESIQVRSIDGAEPILCPDCKRGHLVPRDGRYGPFLGCNRYPACRGKRNLSEQVKGATGTSRRATRPGSVRRKGGTRPGERF